MQKKIIIFSLSFIALGLLFLQPEENLSQNIESKEKKLETHLSHYKKVVDKNIPNIKSNRGPASIKEIRPQQRKISSYAPLQEQMERFQFKGEDLHRINGEEFFMKGSYQMVPLIENIPESSEPLEDLYLKRMGFQLVKNLGQGSKGFGTQYLGVRKNSGKEVVITGDLLIEYRNRTQAAEDLSGYEAIRYKRDQDINPIMPFMVFQVNDLPNNLDICKELKKIDSIKNCNFEIVSGRVSAN